MSSQDAIHGTRIVQQKIAQWIAGFTKEMTDEQAENSGRQAAVCLKRLGMLADSVLIPSGFRVDLNAIAAMLGITQNGARDMMDASNVPCTKPGRSRLYDSENVGKLFADHLADD